jgi:erythromycin esterase-like protein
MKLRYHKISAYSGIGILLLTALILIFNIRNYPRGIKTDPDELQLKKISSISPDDEDYGDLEFLKKEIGNKNIVLLGESMHIDGSTFRAKTRLLKFLHKEMGFDAVIFEAGRYDTWRMKNMLYGSSNGAVPDTSIISQGIWRFWCCSVQTRGLWDYLESSKMNFAGMDIQCSGRIRDTLRSRILFDYLRRFVNDPEKIWPYFHKASLHLHSYFRHNDIKYMVENGTANLQKIFKDMDGIQDTLRKKRMEEKEELHAGNGTSKETEQIDTYIEYVNGVENVIKYRYKYKEGNTKRFEWRDSLMARNISLLLEKSEFAGHKIIIWAANLHEFNDNSQFHARSFHNMGERLKEKFGDDMYTVIFTSYSRHDMGVSTDYYLPRITTLEYSLHNKGIPYIFIANTGAASLNPVRCCVNQGMTYLINLKTMADGIFFIDKMENVAYPHTKKQ